MSIYILHAITFVLALPDPKVQHEPCDEGSSWLEVGRQEVEDPAEEGAHIGRPQNARGILGVKQIFEPAGSTAPIYAHEGHGTQILQDHGYHISHCGLLR